ncbi:tripartite tricarboxylate transporter substrate binding protein [Ramlibacter alkalitolerans]|uniref:Tripartite tricarboxylate transporter substrate binding protein n=1 Tax=Ramlibacter alkalitolerans TaxID=2039631 RepID=A0ABS1JL91_9BURK|nr:tripartite tricarboxylate transporter substrate binding protein [Ramlibacter alkalitolerans]MBL0424985.1 tripartite tricarboxylate transporter substrate binding protein [Ramlibacter alkalitolerans]
MQNTPPALTGAFNRRTALGGLAALALARPTLAAGYPAKTVTLVVPYSPGGGTDIVGRQLAQKLSDRWGQSVVVDNRTGANGVIGSSLVSKAQPDGYTLLLVVGSHAVNPVLMKKMPYDTLTAFTPITNVATSPMVLVVSAKGPYKTLPDVLKAARTEELGVGNSEGQTRLTGELMRQVAGLKTVEVFYKGGAPMMVDVIGGHLPMGFTSVLTALPHVQAGNLRVVGVASRERLNVFPDAMTFAEAGVPGIESLSWYGMFGPAGMPPALVEQIGRDLRAVANEPAVANQLRDQGAQLVLSSPADLDRFLRSEAAKWATVAQRGGIKPE